MKFSIIICGYNEAAHLDTCLSACLKQDYPKDEYEVIYVDNNSTDGSLEIARKYPVKTFVETRQGPSEARNRGIKESWGEILLFLDSDATPCSNYLQVCEKVFNDNSVGAATGKVLPSVKTWVSDYLGVSLLEGYPRFKKRKNMNACPSCNLAVRKSVIGEVGEFLERLSSGNGVTRFSEDKELCGRIRKAGYFIVYEPEMFVLHENIYKFSKLFGVWMKGSLARVGMITLGKRDGLSLFFKYNLPLLYLVLLILAIFLQPIVFYFLLAGGLVVLIVVCLKSAKETGLLYQSLFIKPWMDLLSVIVVNYEILKLRTKNRFNAIDL